MFVGLGVEKLRITGGEPLLRRDLERLDRAGSPALGDLDLTLTTNGALLAQKAEALADGGPHARHGQPRLARRRGLPRDERRRLPGRARARRDRRRGGRGPARSRSTSSSSAALNDGSDPRHGAALPRDRATSCASSSSWTSARRTAGGSTTSSPPPRSSRTIGAEFPLEPVEPAYRGEVAERYRYLDGAGEIGVIASVTQPFCGDCTRARLSADGKLYTCLFAVRGHDLRAVLRSEPSDEELDEAIRAVWDAPHGPLLGAPHRRRRRALRKVEMSYIGG